MILNTITRAVEMQEEIEQDKEVKSVHLGRYLYFMGTVHLGMDNKEQTVVCFKKARDILKRTPEYRDLVNELNYHIQRLKGELGEEESSEEEGEVGATG